MHVILLVICSLTNIFPKEITENYDHNKRTQRENKTVHQIKKNKRKGIRKNKKGLLIMLNLHTFTFSLKKKKKAGRKLSQGLSICLTCTVSI